MTSPSLSELQQTFITAFLTEKAETLVPHVVHASAPPSAEDVVVLYHRIVQHRLKKTLRDGFSVIERLVGTAFFNEAAWQCIQQHLPDSANLNTYGQAFPAFLANYPYVADLPWLSEVAALEWAWQEAYWAPNAPSINLEALLAVPEEAYSRLVLTVHPAVRVRASKWPILSIWEANQADQTGEFSTSLDTPESVLIYRPQERVHVAPLTAQEARFLQALIAGSTLYAAFSEENAEEESAAFQRWLALGLFSGYCFA